MENTKFDMFAGLEERDFNEEPEVQVDEVIEETPSPKKKPGTVIHRTKEEYEEMIDHVYYETHKRPDTGEDYQVKVTVLKPEINPLENMRPVFAYSTNH